ncbi:Hpt domain-containing protein [Pukyongiella litopenaei]|uniref:Hpt domain-containing protein n=1 Tax=Pukyongiella litopenaei TaxID=2605946 RepID=A0A2S0MPR1_9RHOB|nr:Hpt domain-containing protein [Pukyongiella litopenaei]AVO37858.1 Hpt domain-containing protein [Pukyongiella litopenaei]
MIDWARVSDLRDEVGADDFGEIIEIFLDEVGETIAELRGGADPASLEAPLHFLKGSALNLGFAEFSRMCQQGEAAAAAGQGNTIDLNAIIDGYDRSVAAFTAGVVERFSG